MTDRPVTVAELTDQASEAAELAAQAFATGDHVVGIAATVLAAQLLELARAWGGISSDSPLSRI